MVSFRHFLPWWPCFKENTYWQKGTTPALAAMLSQLRCDAGKTAPGRTLAQSQGQMRPIWGGVLWSPWFYRAQNKTLIAVDFLSAPSPSPCDGMPDRFSLKDAFYGAADCWRAASVCSADFNCLSVAIKEPVKYTTVKELQTGARCILGDGN